MDDKTECTLRELISRLPHIEQKKKRKKFQRWIWFAQKPPDGGKLQGYVSKK